MSIKEMIKKVTAKDIKATSKAVKEFKAGSATSHLLSVHPGSASMRQSTLEAIESVLEHPNRDNICLPRAIELVERCREHVMNL